MTVEQLGIALKATRYRFAHFGWSSAPKGDYGVYAEDEGRDFEADGKHVERGTTGTIDLYTRDDSNVPRDVIEQVLNSLELGWKLNDTLYESDTGYIHFEWVWWMHG